MTAIEIGSLILAVEFCFVAWGILFFLMRQHRDLKHADHHHAGAVMEELENGELDRRDALQNLFATTYRLEGEDLDAKVDEYIEREKAFYSAMLSLYLERDGEKLKEMPSELTKVLAPWANMTPSGMVHASEIGDLEEEKEALSTELNTTKHTLEQLMEEYMAAFNKNERPPLPSPPAIEQKPAEPPSEPQPEPEMEATAWPEAEDIPTPEPEQEAAEEEVAEITFDEPPSNQVDAELPREDKEQFDVLQEQEDLDDISLSALGIEPEAPSPTKKPPAPDAIEATDLTEEAFEIADEPEDPAKKPQADPAFDGLDDPLAQEELEGLADLFDPPSEKP